VCVKNGVNTENNNKVNLHKDQIWISAGRIIDKLPAGRTTWCAFSPQTGVDITEPTQKNRRGRDARTHNSFALQSHPFCSALDTHPFSAYTPQRIRLLLLLWLEVCPVKAWLSAGSLFFTGGFHPCIWQNAHSPSLIDPSPLLFAFPAEPAHSHYPSPKSV